MNTLNTPANDFNLNQTNSANHQKDNLMNEYEFKQAMKLEQTQELQANHPYLIPTSNKNSSLIVASKNIRIELKKAFPTIKFSVTSERFAGGDAIRVNWTDCVTVSEVEKIVNKYSAGSFDGMQDLYEYNSTTWTNAFGDAKYITTNRTLSPEFITQIIKQIADIYHDGELPTAEQYKNGSLYSETPSRHCDSWQQMIYRTSRITTFKGNK